MMGFSLTPPNSSLKAPSECIKRSAKAFSLKKASLKLHKGAHLAPRRSRDCSTSSTPAKTSTDIPESSCGDDVICISRGGVFDSSSGGETSPYELRTPSASIYTSSSSSSYRLPPETDDQSLTPVDERDPRRASQLSMISSWVDHHLQELDLSYDEDGMYEIEIVTTDDGVLSRRDSFILPPGETFQSYQQKRNPPAAPANQYSPFSRPLPSTPASPGFNSKSRRIRPLPPPPFS